MAGYIEPEYKEIEKELDSFVQEHELDLITVKSLIRGSVEILEPEMPTASIAVIDNKELSSGISVKPKNIRVNLKFALNSIFSFKSVYDADEKWLIFTVLKTIVFLLEEMRVNLDDNDAIVLFCIYRLQSATIEEIVAYAKKLKENEDDSDIQIENISRALIKLEKIGSVKLEDGKYFLCETILIRK